MVIAHWKYRTSLLTNQYQLCFEISRSFSKTNSSLLCQDYQEHENLLIWQTARFFIIDVIRGSWHDLVNILGNPIESRTRKKDNSFSQITTLAERLHIIVVRLSLFQSCSKMIQALFFNIWIQILHPVEVAYFEYYLSQK